MKTKAQLILMTKIADNWIAEFCNSNGEKVPADQVRFGQYTLPIMYATVPGNILGTSSYNKERWVKTSDSVFVEVEFFGVTAWERLVIPEPKKIVW